MVMKDYCCGKVEAVCMVDMSLTGTKLGAWTVSEPLKATLSGTCHVTIGHNLQVI